jgi:hypothetical protein
MRMQDTQQVVCQLSIATLCRKTDEKWKWLAVLGGKAAKKRPLSCLGGLALLKLAG